MILKAFGEKNGARTEEEMRSRVARYRRIGNPPRSYSYVETRLAEGASIATVRLELSAIRELFQFALDMGASDAMFNPAKNVKVETFTVETST
jgi:hypothetical protein